MALDANHSSAAPGGEINARFKFASIEMACVVLADSGSGHGIGAGLSPGVEL